jgi:hypothetical protein
MTTVRGYELKRTRRPNVFLLDRPGCESVEIKVEVFMSAITLHGVVMADIKEWTLELGKLVRARDITVAEYLALLTAGPCLRTYFINN